MCLPVGGLGYSSERVHLNGCAYQLVAGALEGFCKKNGQGGFARDFQVARAMFVKMIPDVLLISPC